MKFFICLLIFPSVLLAETFAWDPPTTYVGGAPLDPTTELKQYRIYNGSSLYSIITAPATSYTRTIAGGDYVFTITAVAKNGVESEKSAALLYSKQPPARMSILRLGQ